MSRYLLDTNAVITALNDAGSPLARRMRRHLANAVCISAIVARELFYGAFKGTRRPQNVALVDSLQFAVLDFDLQDAREAGAVRAALMSRGTPIGPYDVLIAGQVKARRLTLVTHNVDEFRRIQGLLVEDWQVDAV